MVVRDSALSSARRPPLSYLLPVVGVLAITLATQVHFELPFTPVPITGQTFVIVLWGLLFGMRQGALAASAYLVAGALGAPVFAGFTSLTDLWIPTSGYLLGFVPAAALAGWLKDRGWTHSLVPTIMAALIASIPIFLLGTPILAVFVGWENVIMLGVVPFLIGDIVKSVFAAIVVRLMEK